MKALPLYRKIEALEVQLAGAEFARREATAGWGVARGDVSAKQKEIDELKRRLNKAIHVAQGFAIEILRKYDEAKDPLCHVCNPELCRGPGPYVQCVPHSAAQYLLGQGEVFR